MSTITADQRKELAEQLELVRAKLRDTGATVLSPTPEWAALRKEMLELIKKLK